MTSTNFSAAVAALTALTSDELTALVPHWKLLSKQKRSVAGLQMAVKIQLGQLYYWDSTKRTAPGRHYMRVDGFNRAMTCAKGFECNSKGEVIGGKWTVALSYLRKVESETKNA